MWGEPEVCTVLHCIADVSCKVECFSLSLTHQHGRLLWHYYIVAESLASGTVRRVGSRLVPNYGSRTRSLEGSTLARIIPRTWCMGAR